MNPKMFAKLFTAMQKFIDENCETAEWQNENFYSPDDHALLMAKAAENVHDAVVSSAKYTEEQTR